MLNIQEKLNDALTHHKAGRVDIADKLYNKILEEDPNNHHCLYFSGIIAYENKDLNKAVDLISKASTIHPCAEYYADLANILSDCNQLDKAVEFYGYALNLKPDDFVVYNSLGKAYFKLNNIQESANCFQKAIELNTNFEEAYFELGNLFKNVNAADGAINCYLQTIRLNSQNVEAHLYLGELLKDKTNFTDAAICFREVLKTQPNNPVALYNLGEILEYTNKYDEALACYQQVINLIPDCAIAYHRIGQIFLLKENFEKGWEYYESRLVIRKPEFRINISKPMWNGEPLENKTIYVSSEMGFGDTLMMARYLPVLNSQGTKVICKPQKELRSLFKDSDLKAEIVDSSIPDNQVNCDTYIQFMSLPYKFKTNITNIPNSNGYLKANPEKVSYYKEKYFNNDNLKVGLVWHCKNVYSIDKFRSFEHISSFYNIARLPNIKLYSLQKGDGVDQLANLPDEVEIVDIGSSFNDFSDTAAVIENLDLLISIDTSVPHLAGAMGKPTWLLLPAIKDWKWFLKEKECAWYDSVTLYRQKELGNWDEVLLDLYNELSNFIDKSKKNDFKSSSPKGKNMSQTQNAQNKLVQALEFHKSKNYVQAESLYQEFLNNNPNNDMALQFLGVLYIELGRFTEAVQYLSRCAAIKPSEQIYLDLADAYSNLNQNDAVLDCYIRSLEINPANPELCYRVGMAFYQNGNLPKAIDYLKQVLSYVPDHADTYYLLGMILHNTNQTKQSIEFYNRAIELNLIHDGIYYNLGAALYNEYLFEDAVIAFEKSLELNPNNPDTHNNLGSTYQALNNMEKAIHYYKQAIAISPKPLYKYNLGRAQILIENFEEGWSNFEARIDLFEWHNLKYNPASRPKWSGQPLEGKTIFVYASGGNGDSILFARYLPVLSELGAKVICNPHNGLIDLFKINKDLKAEMIIPDEFPKEEDFDYQLPFFCCNYAFKANIENIPHKEGYLKADPEKVKIYKENYFNNDNYKIGLCWKCSQKTMDTRSIPLKELYRLKEISNVKLYSLQKEDGMDQLLNLPADFEITELGDTFKDFSDTAAAIENLDLVISVDTATVHLAGALGKKTYALLPFAPDWRWLLNREECIWYNSVKLIRQKEFGNWAEVVDRLISLHK